MNPDDHIWREGETVTRDIVALDDRAEGVSADGLRTPGVFPTERVEIRVVHVGGGKRPRAFGKPLRILERHPRRRLPPCPNARRPEAPSESGRCDGCPLMALDESAQRDLKLARLQQEHGLPVTSVEPAPAPLGYRASSKRVAFGGVGRLTLGSWQRGTHKPASMEGCLVDHPRITAVFDELQAVARELGLPAFDERSGIGGLRYAWAKTDGVRVLLTLVSGTDDRAPIEALAQAARSADGIAWSVQSGDGNTMRGTEPEMLRGRAEIEVPFGEASVRVGPGGFLQPNPTAVDAIYRALLADAGGTSPGGARALDLYAGAGLTTRRLRDRFDSVEVCESHPESAAALGIEPTSAERFLAERQGPIDLVVANPPRAGLRAEVCERLLALAPERIHIMSCGPAGLARDLAALGARYEVERVAAWDTLPQTPHVELVAWLRRAESQS